MNLFIDLRQGIKNLWKWFPVIWNDRDWDQCYLYKFLHFKLQNMEDLHRNYGHSLDNRKIADKIKVCKLLLDRLIKDEYYENAFKNHDKKWGELELDWNSNCLIKRPYAITEKEKEKELKEFNRLCQHELYLRRQDINYLFKLMAKHVEGWWD